MSFLPVIVTPWRCSMYSQADMKGHSDTAVDQFLMESDPYRFVTYTGDESYVYK